MQEKQTRKNIRLKGYDYSKKGYYFITICTQNRECILSNVGADPVSARENQNHAEKPIEMHVGADPVSARIDLTHEGKIIEKTLLNLEKEFNNIKIDEYVIMPNHIHVVIEILERADTGSAPTIAKIIQSYKTRTTTLISKEIQNGKIEPYNKRFWQRNYYEHIIRNENEYIQIKKYIKNNPRNWENDSCNKI